MKRNKIQPVGYLKISRASKTHIPELIRRETGIKPGERIPFVMNAHTVLLYNPKLSLEELQASINVLKSDVELRYKKP